MGEKTKLIGRDEIISKTEVEKQVMNMLFKEFTCDGEQGNGSVVRGRVKTRKGFWDWKNVSRFPLSWNVAKTKGGVKDVSQGSSDRMGSRLKHLRRYTIGTGSCIKWQVGD